MLMRMLLLYIVMGGLLCAICAIIFGMFVSGWISLFLSIGYFIGLFLVITYHTQKGKSHEKKLLFNMALIIANLN